MVAKWPLLVEPRMVPPRSSSPLTAEESSVRMLGLPIRPSKPCSMPYTVQPWSISADLTTARITALSPGASPPLVSTPISRIGAAMSVHPRLPMGKNRLLRAENPRATPAAQARVGVGGEVSHLFTFERQGRAGGQGGEEEREAAGADPEGGQVR